MAYARMDYRWTCVRVEYSRKWEQNTRGCVYTRAYSCPLYRIMSWVMCFLRILEEVNARCLWIWSSAAAYFPLSIPIVIFTVAVSSTHDNYRFVLSNEESMDLHFSGSKIGAF